MHNKAQQLNNGCYEIMERLNSVGRAQSGNHKNWVFIGVLSPISSIDLDTLSFFFSLSLSSVTHFENGKPEEKKTREPLKFFQVFSIHLFIYYLYVFLFLDGKNSVVVWEISEWDWNSSKDGLIRRGKCADVSC